MNTQNVNVKTATKESTERWVENLLATAISEQKSLLLYLVELKSKRMRESERSELVWGTLMRMADNVLGAGVVDWHADVLQVHFGVVALFGNENFRTLPFYLYQQIGAYRSQDGAVTALILLLLCFLLFTVIEKLPGRHVKTE